MFLIFFLIVVSYSCTNAYFTLPGKCPENISLQKDFKLADFFGKWHQAYYYSSDHQHLNNCSTIELQTRSTGIYLNQSRVDRKYFHRYSIARVEIPTSLDDAAKLNVSFVFKDAPRRLTTRRYPFRVLATNYNYYATVYTCNYSPLINKHFSKFSVTSRRYPFRVLATNYNYYATVYTFNYSPLIKKHFIYVWVLSRNPILNDVSKELAMKPLQQLGIPEKDLVRDQSECNPKYYEDMNTDPMTFRYPVPVVV